MLYKQKAFTFVELIIVIVIIAILATMGFTMYESYISTGRDTKRISNGKTLETAFQEYTLQSRLPDPNESTDILFSGSLFGQQGFLSEEILKKIALKNDIYDTQLNEYPIYLLLENKKDFQFMFFLEDASNLVHFSNTYAADYINLTPKNFGKPLGIFLDSNTQTPIQKLYPNSHDVVLSGSTLLSYIFDGEYLDTSRDNIFQILPQNSCKRIRDLGYSRGSGIYTLSPDGITKIQAYCDMENNGGGWTLIARTKGGAGNFGWTYSLGTPSDNQNTYSMGIQSLNIAFDKIRFHSSNGVSWIQPNLDGRILSGSGMNTEMTTTQGCEILSRPTIVPGPIPCYVGWGRANLSNRFCFNTDFGDGAPSSCNGIATNGYVGRNNEGVRGFQATIYVK